MAIQFPYEPAVADDRRVVNVDQAPRDEQGAPAPQRIEVPVDWVSNQSVR